MWESLVIIIGIIIFVGLVIFSLPYDNGPPPSDPDALA